MYQGGDCVCGCDLSASFEYSSVCMLNNCLLHVVGWILVLLVSKLHICLLVLYLLFEFKESSLGKLKLQPFLSQTVLSMVVIRDFLSRLFIFSVTFITVLVFCMDAVKM